MNDQSMGREHIGRLLLAKGNEPIDARLRLRDQAREFARLTTIIKGRFRVAEHKPFSDLARKQLDACIEHRLHDIGGWGVALARQRHHRLQQLANLAGIATAVRERLTALAVADALPRIGRRDRHLNDAITAVEPVEQVV